MGRTAYSMHRTAAGMRAHMLVLIRNNCTPTPGIIQRTPDALIFDDWITQTAETTTGLAVMEPATVQAIVMMVAAPVPRRAGPHIHRRSQRRQPLINGEAHAAVAYHDPTLMRERMPRLGGNGKADHAEHCDEGE